MESNKNQPLAPASSTTEVDGQFTAEIAERRRQLVDSGEIPKSPERLSFPALVEKMSQPEPDEKRVEREAIEARMALSRQRAERQGWLAKLIEAVGPAYGDCTLDNFTVTHERQGRVVAALREYAANCLDLIGQRTGLVFYGPVGTGKDHLAFSVCREAIAAGRSVTWVNGQSWFGELRDNMDRGQPEKHAVSLLCRGSILTISDPLPPAGDLTQYQQTMLYRVVERRYSLGLPTFITANVADDAEAYRRLGVPTWDRLCHGAWKVHCAWPSHRKPAREIR